MIMDWKSGVNSDISFSVLYHYYAFIENVSECKGKTSTHTTPITSTNGISDDISNYLY
jgi:hypothetical protein